MSGEEISLGTFSMVIEEIYNPFSDAIENPDPHFKRVIKGLHEHYTGLDHEERKRFAKSPLMETYLSNI